MNEPELPAKPRPVIDYTERLIQAEFQLLSKKPKAATIPVDAALLACD